MALGMVLLSAGFHAGWNLLARQASDKLTFLWLQMALAAGALALPCLFLSAPDPRAYPFALLSGLLQTAYYLLLAQTYTCAAVSRVYPLTRGSAPLFVCLLSLAAGDKAVTAAMLPPIFLIVLGLYGINLEGWGRRRLLAPLRTLAKEPRTRLSLLNGLVIAAYTLTDGRTVRYADPLWIYFWISVIPAALLAPAMLRQGRIRREWKRDGLRAAAVSALTFAAYALVLLAMRRGSAACVSAVREVSIVFVTLYARFVLREKMPAVKLLSSAVIFLGILLLDLGPR